MNTREFVSYYKKLRKEQDETIEYEEAREEIEEIFNLIAEVIAMDEEVKFKNKGTFSLLKRKKRRIRIRLLPNGYLPCRQPENMRSMFHIRHYPIA